MISLPCLIVDENITISIQPDLVDELGDAPASNLKQAIDGI
jgi:hypothetical protein